MNQISICPIFCLLKGRYKLQAFGPLGGLGFGVQGIGRSCSLFFCFMVDKDRFCKTQAGLRT